MLLAMADDRLVLGHRLSEWCGHGPILEEELALANVALDLIGQAEALYRLAAERQGEGRSADDLAFLRDARAYRNVRLVEQPNGDFAHTMLRQFLFDAWDAAALEGLRESSDPELAAFAEKAAKEAAYHLRHSREWVKRLGDGTEESHARMQAALAALWHLTGELFAPGEHGAPPRELAPALEDLRLAWQAEVEATFAAATLPVPEPAPCTAYGRDGLHSEFLGHLLAEMQVLPRSYPGATW